MTVKPGLPYYFYSWIGKGLDLLFPPNCAGCGKPGQHWCHDCQKKIIPVPEPVCEICGEPQHETGICKKCHTTRPAYQVLRSCVVFKEPIRSALHRLKYRRDIGVGESLAWIVAGYLDRAGWQADSIVPIPLSQQRMAERGYNQVGVIALPLARIMRWKYEPGALRRNRHTRSQVGLNADERQKNVDGAFETRQPLVQGKTLLLMDDTATTGATLNAAAHTLMDAGASKIYALTVAKALHKYGLDQVAETSSFRPLR